MKALRALIAAAMFLLPFSLGAQSIAWWLGKNHKADTTSKLTFGLLDAESSMVQAFQNAGKERGKGRTAACFDIRGYTVICLKKGNQYSLAWCEPIWNIWHLK